MLINFTRTEIEQIKDMLSHAKEHNYFEWYCTEQNKVDKEIHETILRKLDIGE